MDEVKAQFIDVEDGASARRVALRMRPGRAPVVAWLPGLHSDMDSTKATALDAHCAAAGRACLRLDYTGHGLSATSEPGGRFEDGTVGIWLADARAALDRFGGEGPVLVGSSMGAWIALLLAVERARAGRPLGALVLIAPAVDFTEALIWENFAPETQAAIERTGRTERPSAYSETPYPITRALIEDGRRHLLLGASIEPGCPVTILQGLADPDVPWSHALRLLERLPADDVALTLVPDGDHRLSRPEDIALLLAAVERAAGSNAPAPAPA